MANQPKKYKKFVATAATATLVASAIVPVASAASLSDIAGNTHEEAIKALVDAKVINGYADGTFKPNKTLTRSDVVKLLGKYLETEGYAPAADYKESPAFNDLKRNSNEELLKYASIVKEAGVFAGSNGNLLAGDKITRENMAITLVRMINTLKDVSLEEYVAAQDFKGDVKDLNVAKAEARTAIAVLDFYDITNPSVSNFNPKGDTTRGQFATFLHKTINADFAGASATTGTVTAINNTTVEVKFGKEIGDISALKFSIDGLEVKNAVVKQSDKTTVVLTTAAQEAGKAYTVKLNGDKVGGFTGVSAVIPTKVDIVEKSLQEAVGTQVTLKAQVTVAEGQSKAGIPVTFNIVNNSNVGTALLNQPIVVEATTDENGVASYTYTRYAQTTLQIASYDEVQAYATGDATKRSFSKVYWANIKPLTITEVTQGNEIQNGGKKVYKVTAALNHVETITQAQYDANRTAYEAKGVYSAGNYVNIGYRENTDVTPDQAKKKVDVIDAAGRNLGYPGQYLTSTSGANNPTTNNWVKEIKIKLDNSGSAIFTLSGLDEAVTPFVFVDQTNTLSNSPETVGRVEATELFAQAPTVKFAKIHSLLTTLTPVGEQYAASFYNNDTDRIANNLERYLGRSLTTTELKAALVDAGGRDYKITITDKDGKLAPRGTKVGLDVAIGSPFREFGGAVYLVDNNTRTITKLTDDASKGNALTDLQKLNLLTTDEKGEVSFTLIGYKDAYATPEVVINSGNDQAKIDANDQKVKGEIVYFSDARVSKSVLSVSKAQASADGVDFVEYVYQTVDQNGKAYRPHINNLDLNNDRVNDNYVPVSFEISTTFNEVRVTPGDFGLNKHFENLSGANQTSVTVGPDSMGNHISGSLQYRSLVVITDEFGRASVKVYGIDGRETSVNVTASTTLSSLPQLLTASAQLIGNNLVPVNYEGIVTEFNPLTNSLTFAGKAAISYTYSIFFNGTAQVTEQEFEKLLNDAEGTVVVKRELTATGNKFTIVSSAKTGLAPKNAATAVVADKTALQTAVNVEDTAALVEANYTPATWATYAAALTNAKSVLANTNADQTTVNNAVTALTTAKAGLVAVNQGDITLTSSTYSDLQGLAGVVVFNLAGTIATADVASVKVSVIDGTSQDATYDAATKTFTFTKNSVAPTAGTVKVIAYKADGSVADTFTVNVTKQ